nr:alpha/beta hydrolase [Agrococcus sp. ARC_14]
MPTIVAINLGMGLMGVLGSFGVRAAFAFYATKDYFIKHVRAAEALGFAERQIIVRDDTALNVAEKAGDGIPLLLIPGQGSVWQEYCKALPSLVDTFHVLAVDVHGHGGSSWNSDDYAADQIAEDLVVLVDRVFAEPVVIAGHSSGGLIAALMAARFPDHVRAVLFEDSPFFSTEPERVPHTYVGIDQYPRVTSFLAQDVEHDWVSWYMHHSYWRRLFGPLWQVFARVVMRQRREDSRRLPVVRWVSVSINRIWESLSHPYDLRFSAAFINNSWFRNFEQQQTLGAIRCPTAFLKATTRHDRQGNLLAALDDHDLARVESLLPDNRTIRVRSSHDIHFARTNRYVTALKQLGARVS